MIYNIIQVGDCRAILKEWALSGVRVQTCVTSPPYFGLRDYGHPGQIGLEQTPEQYIAAMVEVFRCVRDVLADDGTLWLNIGDSYATDPKGPDGGKSTSGLAGGGGYQHEATPPGLGKWNYRQAGYKRKDLIGIPWMLAFALRADGWYLRQDIIWHKPNPMPESVRDRCTKAHEYVFLLSKSEKYYFYSEAMKEPATSKGGGGFSREYAESQIGHGAMRLDRPDTGGLRNRRSVWSIATRPYKGAHFATFPPALIEPCILAGSDPGDIVLDPFMGSGTTAGVAVKNNRRYLGCELNQEYANLAHDRITSIAGANQELV